LLVAQRVHRSVVVPLNLLSVPYHAASTFYSIAWALFNLGRTRKALLASSGNSAAISRKMLQTATNNLLALSSPLSPSKPQKDPRDANVVQRIDRIRLLLIERLERKTHFERSIARFCRAQDENGPLGAEEMRELLRETLKESVFVAQLMQKTRSATPQDGNRDSGRPKSSERSVSGSDTGVTKSTRL
jgi:hypothetical protein